ncbi:DNA internalization-related competence protein ComEC/Rec2 [Alcaligenes faecalis]|uniref:DNA internalization-related competence protein ComEC/Rec2 n=1 Tax=Alcaligenes faecalis TaxID=511 RepID=UPI002932677F|nr:DNA internalization-related competence protein ComEC/Rec2 [Alcaligenes faecalis]MDV2116982.1 DNA internalization-related competence protein ComEC/Rec2 [Alcaligenes faecalis]
MIGRACLAAFVVAATFIHFLKPPYLTLPVWLWLGGAVLSFFLAQRFSFAYVLVFACLGAGYSVWHIQGRLAQFVLAADTNKVSRVELEIQSLIQAGPNYRQFRAKVLRAQPPGLPEQILVRWTAAQGHRSLYREPSEQRFPELMPGQRWRMSLVVRPPQGARNPHGFDAERHAMIQGWRAVGSVRGQPELLGFDPAQSWSTWMQRLRHHLRSVLMPYVQEQRWGGVMLALSLGDQASISPSDWLVFNRTGLTHLVSISGTHVTFLAVLLAALVSWCWRRVCWGRWVLAEQIPAQVAATWVGIAGAGAYCVIAGWGVPAQRTFLMLLVLGVCRLWGLHLGASRTLLIAALCVVLHDPWAGLTTGFYLSFAAVSVLLAFGYLMGQVPQPGSGVRRWGRRIWCATQLQVLITVALLPALAPLFHEISLASLPANAYAITLIGSLVTPLVLLLLILAALQAPPVWCESVSYLAHRVLDFTMQPTVWLAEHSLASVPVPAQHWAWTVLALLGVLLLLLPKGFVSRLSGLSLLLPALALRPSLLQEGDWDLFALDVGQGSAVVLRTRSQVLVFDVGNRYGPDSDEGKRSIVPWLKAKGIGRIDTLVLSHADMDHVGGTRSVLQAVPVGRAYSSFDLDAHLSREERLLGVSTGSTARPEQALRCEQDVSWEVDGVRFRFWWPPADKASFKAVFGREEDKNAISCVLEVQGPRHSALLLGDAGVAQEQAMVAAGLRSIDVVVVGHHGSRTSSGAYFVKQMQAGLAIAQLGWWNRFSHPHPLVQARWERAGALFLRTDQWGALTVESRPSALYYFGERDRYARYWQSPAPP